MFWPAIITLVLFAAACGLGVWQVRRLHWKLGLLAQLDRAEAAAPVPLPPDPEPFSKVIATGHMRDDLRAYYGVDVRSGAAGPMIGAQLITPLELADGRIVLVDRGWMPEHAAAPPSPDPVSVTGYVRPPESPPMFGASDDPRARRFFGLDPVAIGAALGLGRVAPFTLVALGPSAGLPEPAHALPRPPNDHLSYAITWFGLAAVSLGVFAVYAKGVLRA